MLKRYLKPTIIGVIQCFLLVFLIACIAPLLLKNTSALNHWQEHLQHFKWAFLIFHGIFYVLLYLLWPYFIRLLCRKQEKPPSDEQLHYALQARLYLIGTFLIFECLTILLR